MKILNLNTKSSLKKRNNKNNHHQADYRHQAAAAVYEPLPAALITLSVILFSAQLINQTICAVSAATTTGTQQLQNNNSKNQEQKALEAELNSIVEQHDKEINEGNNRQLAEALITRLMSVDNLTGGSSNLFSPNENLGGVGIAESNNEFITTLSEPSSVGGNEFTMNDSNNNNNLISDYADSPPSTTTYSGPSGLEAMKWKKLLSFLENHENGNRVYNQYPSLPGGEFNTMKRAAAKMGNYLQRGYSKSSFDFGLGKRPDSSATLRLGDLPSSGGMAHPVGQFGKRPSANRYDFGLGKRLANPAYPRYDFGLGKRAPARVRYDFGLGKK